MSTCAHICPYCSQQPLRQLTEQNLKELKVLLDELLEADKVTVAAIHLAHRLGVDLTQRPPPALLRLDIDRPVTAPLTAEVHGTRFQVHVSRINYDHGLSDYMQAVDRHITIVLEGYPLP